MSQVQADLAKLNAIGNGALEGPYGNAGTATGLLAGLGADLSVDAVNSMGAISDEESGSTERFEVHEEVYDFTATQTPATNNGSMGSFSAGDDGDLKTINANNFSA